MNYLPHHTAISVRNIEESVRFYETLGYRQVHRYDEEDGSMGIVHMKLGNSYIELFVFRSNQARPALELEYANNLQQVGVKHIALQVEDGSLEDALEDLRAKGLADENTKITQGRTKVAYFFIKDPDGVWVEIVKDDRYK